MDEIIQLANKAMNMLEVTGLNNKDKTLITDVIHKIRKQAFSLNGVVKSLPSKKDIIFDDSLMAEIETTDNNLKVLRAVNGFGQAINIAKVQINDK